MCALRGYPRFQTDGEEDTIMIQGVRFFLRTSLNKMRTARLIVFGRPPKLWPSIMNFRYWHLGLFAYAIAGVEFISSASHRLQERLDLLLSVELTVDVDIDEI
jgi:hypothetical protein